MPYTIVQFTARRGMVVLVFAEAPPEFAEDDWKRPTLRPSFPFSQPSSDTQRHMRIERYGSDIIIIDKMAWDIWLVPLSASFKRTSCFVSLRFCPVVRCPRLSPPPHSVQTGCRYAATDNVFGDKCHFSCEIGHHRVGGSTQRVCQADGSWSGKEIICQGKR